MKALVTTAFALTLLLSALTVYFALRSSTLDGEPYATMAINPPKINAAASQQPSMRPKAPKVASRPAPVVVPANEVSTPRTRPAGAATDQVSVVPDQPPTAPGTESASADTVPEPVEITRAVNSATPPPTSIDPAAPPAPTHKAATADTATVDPTAGLLLVPAEQGFGLGVGNLGPLDTANTTN